MKGTPALGAGNPPLAHQALQTELDIGLLLPCNVVVMRKMPEDARLQPSTPRP
jgi:uncharacterized protein (DUF302 family)